MSDFAAIPAVHRLLEHPSIAPYEDLVGRDALRELIGAELDRARASDKTQAFGTILSGLVQRIDAHAARALRGVINATGTLLHTNLGRAPISPEAFAHAREIAAAYSNLEYDLYEGERGSRYEHASDLLRRITGAQDALVVNNCAAAVLLILDTFARGAEVIVARNQLIEIGGGFRLPDVLQRSGARLVEAGTTNKVYAQDFKRALTAKTALIMRSHQSNFSVEGFTHDAEPAELAALGKHAGVAVVEDLGSGALVDLSAYGLPRERTVMDAVRDGMSLVAFSGDKLLGGPQAGIIVGTRAHVARLRANPLLRALRVDKVTLALLAATLRAVADPGKRLQIPFLGMLASSTGELRSRAAQIAGDWGALSVVEMEGQVGGGSLPHARIPSAGLRISSAHPDGTAAALRAGRTPVLARIEDQAVLLDLRTVFPHQDDDLRQTLQRTLM